MEQNVVLDLARQGMTVALMVSLPILAAALFVGLLVSVFQAVTQVQEQTLSFVPKIVATFLSVVMYGPWIANEVVVFARETLGMMASFGPRHPM